LSSILFLYLYLYLFLFSSSSSSSSLSQIFWLQEKMRELDFLPSGNHIRRRSSSNSNSSQYLDFSIASDARLATLSTQSMTRGCSAPPALDE